MNPVLLIDKKRQGLAHTEEELAFLVAGAMSGEIPDYQLSAWLMAVCCQGLSLEETTWLTRLYVESGQILDFSDLDGVVADKHSTGGVGDKTTLILAPLLAACGLKVAKLSGRGLGYTGGTADKLESIPGFQVDLPVSRFMQQVRTIGIALGSQTAELAPADGKLYALRDVTATVASIPLIAASVISKKIAAGARVITLDIKAGEGAFMKSLEEAKVLAEVCREVGRRLDRKISTVISDMNQPLGDAIGHTLEVMEAIDTLKGQGPQDLTDLCLTLGSLTLVDAGSAPTLDAGRRMLEEAIASGRALATFKTLIEAQGGDSRVLEEPERMPGPSRKLTVTSGQTGYVQACHALKIAEAAKVLGAGRTRKDTPIDLGVGVRLHKKMGDPVLPESPLAELWVKTQNVQEAEALVLAAFEIGPNPPEIPPLVLEIVSPVLNGESA